MKGVFAVSWGITGVLALLCSAIYRLSWRASGLLGFKLSWEHWAVLIGGIAFMAYSEGYRGFQRNFSPRVAARARHLRKHATTAQAVFAPLFLLSYFGAERKRQVVSIVLTVSIIGLVLMVRLVPSPWREIIDVGVVIGLVWGVLSVLYFLVLAFRSPGFSHPTEVPGACEN